MAWSGGISVAWLQTLTGPREWCETHHPPCGYPRDIGGRERLQGAGGYTEAPHEWDMVLHGLGSPTRLTVGSLCQGPSGRPSRTGDSAGPCMVSGANSG